MLRWTLLQKLIWLRILKAASFIIHTITGSAPLILTNAVSHAIHSLTQYGLCTQASTPTPDAPVDIMCNNGALRMVDDELPSGYTRLTYIESDGTSGSSGSNGYVDTGILINSIDTDVEIDFQLTDTYSPSPRMAWGFMGTPSSLPRWGFGAYSSKWLGSPNATASTGAVDTDRHVAVMRVYGSSNSAFYDGTLDGETIYNANSLGNVSVFEDNDQWPVYLFARNNNNTAENFVPCKIFRFKVYKAGALTYDLVPCKDGNGALGFYDLVTATFSVASGTLIAGAADYSHAHIGADGTPEVLTVSGVNLCAPAYYTGEGWYIAASNKVANASSNGTLVFPCKPNTTYSWWHTDGKGGERAFELTTDTVTLGQEATWAVGNPAYNDAMTVRKYTTSSDAKLLCVAFARVDAERVGRTKEEQFADFMLVEGDITTATSYEPYVTPQTVTNLPMLLSVGDYADEAEIISGIKTGKVGIYVFTGEEAFTKGSAFYTTNTSFLPSKAGSITPICTHFEGISSSASRVADSLTMTVNGPSGSFTGCVYFYADRSLYATAADFKAWLASEYAAGTPVIVLYSLAEETTETVTAQPLTLVEGTNIITVESNVDPVTLDVEYKASA